MRPAFREPIKPGVSFPWMANANRFMLFSGLLTLVSILSLSVRGLDLGIDFKGGTKVIAAFKTDANASADGIRDAVGALIKERLGTDPGQIEVQTFNVGDVNSKGEAVQKFQIYTELTSLLTPERATAVSEAMKKAVGAERIDRPEETDKFIVVLAQPAPVNATKKALSDTLGGLGFKDVELVSDEEQAFDMAFFKDYNLTFVEREKAGEKIPDDDYDQAKSAHDAKKAAALATRTDRVFTVSLQQIQTDLEAALTKQFGADKVEVESATAVSASVGADLFAKGILALIYAIIGIVIYVGLRFDFRFGPGAVISLVHDAFITLGVFSLAGLKFTLPIVSAILTIIGYSINDTIVVYDRIRENQEKLKGMDLSRLIDISINETLSRTVLTGGSALLVTCALMALGGGLIADFAFALTFGIIVGTYSSIAVAVPFTIYIENWLAARRARALAGPGSTSSAAA